MDGNCPFVWLGESRLGVPEQVALLIQMVAVDEGFGAVVAACSSADAQPPVGESDNGASAGTELVVGELLADPVGVETAAMDVQLGLDPYMVGLSASRLAVAFSRAAIDGTALAHSGLGGDMF